MPRLTVAADIIEEVYNNAKVKANGSKLENSDFLQMVIISVGSFLRTQFYEHAQLDGETGSFLSSLLEVKKFAVKKFGSGMGIVDQEIFIAPRNMGIFGVYPVIKCGDESEPDLENRFLRVKPGTESFYNKKRRDDLGINTFSMRGVKPLLGTDLEEVYVEAIFADDDSIEQLNFPVSVVKLAISDILTTVLKVPGYVDMTDDRDPNVKAIKERLQTSN